MLYLSNFSISLSFSLALDSPKTEQLPPLQLINLLQRITIFNCPLASFNLSKHLSDLTKSTKLSRSIRHEEQLKESSEVSWVVSKRKMRAKPVIFATLQPRSLATLKNASSRHLAIRNRRYLQTRSIRARSLEKIPKIPRIQKRGTRTWSQTSRVSKISGSISFQKAPSLLLAPACFSKKEPPLDPIQSI